MRKIITSFIFLIIIPILVILGIILFNDKQYDIISLLIAFFACVPFFVLFEKRKPEAREIVLISVLTALIVVSRIAFSFIPSFKPVMALIIIIAIVYGKEMGFMVGALTAVLSNIYFGQGPWTPLQMFSWGFIGYMAGVFMKVFSTKTKLINYFLIILYGIISAIIFSLIMDIHTMFFIDNSFNLKRYMAITVVSLPITFTYIISNVIFLALFFEPITTILKRVKEKYGMYQ